jgi:hypothetical protein
MKNNLVITILVAVIVGGAAFFGGMQYGKSQATTGTGLFAQNGQGQRGTGRRLGNGNGAPVTGKIVAQDATSITIQTQDGSQKIVDIAGSTTISKTSSGSASDLKSGDEIAAFGTTNSDGSITAQNVQINPMFRNGGRGGSVSPQPSK